MYPGHLDILKNLEELVPSEKVVIPVWVIGELEAISKKQGKVGASGRLGLKYIGMLRKKKVLNVIDDSECNSSNKYVDEKILCLAKKNRAIVCTNDKRMIRWAKSNKLRVISVRSDRRLDFV